MRNQKIKTIKVFFIFFLIIFLFWFEFKSKNYFDCSYDNIPLNNKKINVLLLGQMYGLTSNEQNYKSIVKAYNKIIKNQKIDIIIFMGDMTYQGLRKEIIKFKKNIIENLIIKKIYYLPGNHDLWYFKSIKNFTSNFNKVSVLISNEAYNIILINTVTQQSFSRSIIRKIIYNKQNEWNLRRQGGGGGDLHCSSANILNSLDNNKNNIIISHHAIFNTDYLKNSKDPRYINDNIYNIQILFNKIKTLKNLSAIISADGSITENKQTVDMGINKIVFKNTNYNELQSALILKINNDKYLAEFLNFNFVK